MRQSLLAPLFCASLLAGNPEAEVAVHPNVAPGSGSVETTRLAPPRGERVVSNVHRATITPYLPAAPTGTAVIIAPGGGHRELWTDHEGHNVARWLSDHGVAAFVLKYRLAREKGSKYTIEGDALSDMLAALALVRGRAAEWKIDPAKVGVMGFSAGGELAALAGVNAAKPAFQALVYPAIPQNLALSKDTAPAFLVCGENDRQNISQGLPELYLGLKRAGVSSELHVYGGVGHGFGLRADMKGPVKEWLIRFHEWLGTRGLL
ncbi:MAG TPA: alpha/beta hydrolase [Bryobacteraceae bacterium]|nr:alpha/beta hydrolase [Bryobacteraceae bacterium]